MEQNIKCSRNMDNLKNVVDSKYLFKHFLFIRRNMDQMWRHFKKIFKTKKNVRINKSTIITIEKVEIVGSFCGGCNVKYDCIHLKGIIKNKSYNDHFEACITPWDLFCKCEHTTDPLPLFKAMIGKDIYNRYISYKDLVKYN